MATNGSIRSCSGGHWAKTSGAVDVVMRSLGFWAPRSRWTQQCRKYPAWQWYALRTMWWVPSYAQIHWSTVGRPTSQRDFVDSNKTSESDSIFLAFKTPWCCRLRSSSSLSFSDAYRYHPFDYYFDQRPGHTGRVLVDSCHNVLGRLAFSLLLFLILVYHLKKCSMVYTTQTYHIWYNSNFWVNCILFCHLSSILYISIPS